MSKIGIICAMNEEMTEIKKLMTAVEEKEIFGLDFFEGKINETEVVLVECGIGKVNAGRTTQIMIDKFEVESIINIGVAGAIDRELDITDVVICDKVVQHDFDITAFGHEKGHIPGMGIYAYADEKLVEDCTKVMKEIGTNKDYKVKIGPIASGDIFCTSRDMADKIGMKFKALCVEMEGAAIGQVCFLDKVPFIVIRTISDSPNGNNNVTFDKCLQIAAKRGAEFIKKLLK